MNFRRPEEVSIPSLTETMLNGLITNSNEKKFVQCVNFLSPPDKIQSKKTEMDNRKIQTAYNTPLWKNASWR